MHDRKKRGRSPADVICFLNGRLPLKLPANSRKAYQSAAEEEGGCRDRISHRFRRAALESEISTEEDKVSGLALDLVGEFSAILEIF